VEPGLLEFPGYEVLDRVHDGPTTAVYRVLRVRDGLAASIRMLKPQQATPLRLSRLVQEYEVLRSLKSDRILKAYDLETHGQSVWLVLEGYGGVLLSDLFEQWGPLGQGFLSAETFLTLADQIVEALAVLHQAGLVHRGICPRSIACDPATRTIKIVDVSTATPLGREMSELTLVTGARRLLSYNAPEQTGRMNRSVDYRADFYSLGATLYEMLTGRPPFDASDPVELVHSHLARTAVAPHVVNAHVPVAVSEIVLKLLAKSPEARYQSTKGLRYDLEACAHALRTEGKISSFDLGQQDRGEQFLVPERLYGREAEIEVLLAAFERAARGRVELVLVAGSSGIGKSSVVNEVQKPIALRHGYFAKGKFDQLNRGIPFSAFLWALRDLMKQLLRGTREPLQRLRADILSALGDSGQVMIDVVPELAEIIGPQPAVPELSGAVAQARFQLLFRRFLSVLATQDHPLVLFLDDMHWADLASLQLLTLLLDEHQEASLLLVGAYRDQEVGATHPLALALEELGKAGVETTKITLLPLAERHINQLIADTLCCSLARAAPLATLVYRKTQGNPFFNHQFLNALHKDGLIAFNGETGYWECDIGRLSSLTLTDDIAEFMILQLQKLPESARRLLSLAACMGNSFDLATLAIVAQTSQLATTTELWPALHAGLVLPQTNVYRLYRGGALEPDNPFHDPAETPTYRFSHDRVQQAAYLLIPEERLRSTHLHIGRLLLANTPESAWDEKLFEIVSHLNRGVASVQVQTEKRALAELNLRAGRRAKTSTAYGLAREYLAVARSLLEPGSWRNDYALTLELHEISAEVAYLDCDFAEMDDLIDTILDETSTPLDRIKAQEVRIVALETRGMLKEATEVGLNVLASLGTVFPLTPTQDDVLSAIQQTHSAYAERGVSALVDVPLMQDPYQSAAMRILSATSAAAFLCAPHLYPLIISKQVRLSIQHGNAPESAFCYVSYGLILCGAVENVEEGYEFGQLALELQRRLNAPEWRCKVFGVVHTFIVHWKKHVRETIAPLRTNYHLGLESGDLQFASYSGFCSCAYAYFPGIDMALPQLEQSIVGFSEAMRRLKQITILQYLQMLHQSVHDLRQGRESFTYLCGEHYDERVMLPRHAESQDRHGLFCLFFSKLCLSYLYREYRQALQDTTQAEAYLDVGKGFPYLPVYYQYDSLTRLAVQRTGEPEDLQELAPKIEANQEKLRAWARLAPMNCQHRVDLVEAELEAARGNAVEAMAAYDRAIQGAKEQGFLREEALANELAGEFYLRWGKEKVAHAYLRDAYAGYARWGATGKTSQLDRIHAWLPSVVNIAPEVVTPADHGEGVSLDLATVVKAMQAIAGEIEISRLLEKLMRIALENAGAQRGALVLERSGRWVIEAEGEVDTGAVRVLQSLDLQESDSVSSTIVLSVAASRTSVVLDDATQAGGAFQDPYLTQQQVKSVICTPLINRGRVGGILYLENNLTRSAFTPERLALLKLLSVQMALSLNNALLYQHAQAEIEERKQAEEALRRANHVIESSPVVAFRWGRGEGRAVEYVSRNIEQFGYTPEDLMRGETSYRALIHSEDVARVEEEARRQVSSGANTVRLEYRILTKDGRVRWLDDRTTVRRTPAGDVEHYEGIVVDITERVRAEQEVQTLNRDLERRVQERTAQLERANQELESFSYSVSHDLRAPLRAVDGFARVLVEEHGAKLDAEGKHLCSMVRDNARRMRELIDDLLAFSRLGRTEMRATPIDMNQLFRAAYEELGMPQLRERVDLRLGELPPCKGDPTMIRQVWTNLLSNALKFSAKRDRIIVEVGCIHEGGENVYYVKDNGAGFSMRYAHKLFGVFQRLHSGQEFEGTGVGLAIVQRVILRHGGRVWSKSEPEQGATFYFALGR
jgi:PAS domain S-box-containing protein